MSIVIDYNLPLGFKEGGLLPLRVRPLPAGGTKINLADTGVEIKTTYERDIAFKVVARRDLIPLTCLSQILPRNKWPALMGWSEQTVQPLLSGAGGTDMIVSDSILTQLTPEVSPERANTFGPSPNDLFHVVEIE